MTRRLLAAFGPVLAMALLALVAFGAAWACTRATPDPARWPAPLNSAVQLSAPGVPLADTGMVALRTGAVAASVGLLATLLAWPVAWGLRGRARLVALAALTPMLLPQYLVYAAWGVARGPGTWLGDALMRAGARGDASWWWEAARWTQAVGGLSLWAWPVALLALLPSLSRVDASMLDALRLSGAGPLARAGVVFGHARAGFAWAFALVALLMLGSAVPIHVAQIETWSIGVWRALMESGGGAPAWRAAAPLMLLTAALGAGLAWHAVSRGHDDADEPAEVRPVPPGWARSLWPVAAVWCLSVVVPAALLLMYLKQWSSLGRFWAECDGAAAFSFGCAAAVAAVVTLIAVSTAAGFARHHPRSATMGIAAWAALAMTPGVLIGSALLSACLATPGLARLGDSALGIIAAHVARFGVVGALAGWWVARAEPRALRDTRRMLDDSLLGWWSGVGTPALGVFACAGLAAGMLSMHEIESAVIIAPAGVWTLSQHMLNLLHYLRDEQLTAGTLWLLALGGLASLLGVLLLRASAVWRARFTRAGVVLLPVLLVFGCGRDVGEHGTPPLPALAWFGEPGRAPGQFVKPRAIDTDGERLFVIDMTGRCQVLSADGRPLAWWTMPSIDRGKPTGITWLAPGWNGASDATALVADSHESRVAVYTIPPRAAGALDLPIARQWGGYGTEQGRFIFPADVLALPDRVYVSEYGGNDRVSVFERSGAFLFSFGSEGDSASPELVQFRRPQALLWDAQTDSLVVADSCNHRVGLFDRDGGLKRWIGRAGALPGTALGEFNYPMGLAQLPDGTVLVSEQGNARVQRIDLERAVGLAAYGRRGAGAGEFDTPWGIAVIGDRAYVCDAGKHQVISFTVPEMPWPQLARAGSDAP